MKDLWKRTLTALVLAVVGVGSVLLSQYGFALLAMVLIGALIFEFSRLTEGMTRYPQKWRRAIYVYRAIAGIASFAIIFVWVSFQINILPLLAIMPIFVILPELKLATDKAFNQIMLGVFSLIYIAMPIAMASLIAFPNGAYQPSYLIGMLLLVWVTDVFAYLVGKAIGKRPLARKVSPKKTIEGTAGGVVGAVAFSLLLQFFWPLNYSFDWPVIAVIAGVAGSAGDLAESLMKRNLHIKDSGTILPGHGGLLDRFDSMLFSIPAVLIYMLMRNIIL